MTSSAASGCPALDALEREYEAVLRQKPITPIELDVAPTTRQKPAPDADDMSEGGQEYDDLQSICSYAATCNDDDLEQRDRLNEDSDDENQGYEYEPLQENEWEDDDDAADDVKPVKEASSAAKKSIKMTDNDKEAIKRAMEQISLPAPTWGGKLTDAQLVELVTEATHASTISVDEPVEP
ncbi:Aste57867_16027 [Aphanomyces stellatus]|uniref:Aste57867_16027 protein n=1 Tax=Aphanomyces stellatus TaxID=120398 RepID=A0A485L5J5_9STRA|nr:hypothetical protein As57867_015971 [Aphanomyces stellatus]VFT92812.1 Aste57867_16027 [Aphanomyces stellatus]